MWFLNFIYAFFLGIFGALGFILVIEIYRGKIKKFGPFTSPSTGEFNFNWGIREILRWVSERQSQIWYECLEHEHLSYRKTILCMLGIKYYFFILWENDHDDTRYKQTTHEFWGRVSAKNIKEKLNHKSIVAPEGFSMYYQTFVPGYNVVADFMNGCFLK